MGPVVAQLVERPLCDREVVGSVPGIKMALAALLLGAQHYDRKARTGQPVGPWEEVLV